MDIELGVLKILVCRELPIDEMKSSIIESDMIKRLVQKNKYKRKFTAHRLLNRL